MLAVSIVFTGLLVWISAIVQHVTNVKLRGASYVMSDRSKATSDEGFLGRAGRTLRNNMESSLMFVPIALVAEISHARTSIATWSAAAYIAARAIFTVSYWWNINPLRSYAWSVGMLAVIAIAADTLLAHPK